MFTRESSLLEFSGIGTDKPMDGKEVRNYILAVGLTHSIDEAE